MQCPSSSLSRCLLAALSGIVNLASGQDVGTLARECNASTPPGGPHLGDRSNPVPEFVGPLQQ